MLCLQSPPPIFFHLEQLSAVVFWCAKNVCVHVCVFSNIFSETTGPTEAKFNVEPPWDRGRRFIQLVKVICCSSLLSTSGGRGLLAGILPQICPLQCKAFSRALKTEKLKAPLFPGPIGAETTNVWCISESSTKVFMKMKVLLYHHRIQVVNN